MRWVRHILRMGGNVNGCRGLVGKSEEMRPFGKLGRGRYCIKIPYISHK